MAGPNSLEDLRELWEPIKDLFDGIVVTYHGDRLDPEAVYLEANCGMGRVIYLPYSQRHSLSRMVYLHCGPIQDGDWVAQCDVLERLKPFFIKNVLIPFVMEWRSTFPNILYYHGKVILYQYHESLRFNGSPHEGLHRDDGQMRGWDITPMFPKEEEVRENVRPLKRKDPMGWVQHYMKYWLFPFGSNHALLGLEKRTGDLNANFMARETRRLAFREEVRRRGYPLTVEGVKKMFTEGLDDILKEHINNELVVHDFYRYVILGDITLIDNHNPDSIKPIL